MVIFVESGIGDSLLSVTYAMLFRGVRLQFPPVKIDVVGTVSQVILLVIVPKIWIPLPLLRVKIHAFG